MHYAKALGLGWGDWIARIAPDWWSFPGIAGSANVAHAS